MKKPIKNGKEVFAVLSMATVMSISMSVKADAASTESKKDLAAESAYTATIINDVATSGYTSGIEGSQEINAMDFIGLGIEFGDEIVPAALQASQEATDPNYAKDEKNVGTYKETQLERGNGPAFSISEPEMDFIDGFRYSTLEPSATSHDKTLWGLEFEFDKEKGQRTYTDFGFTNTGNYGRPSTLEPGNISANEAGEKLSEGFKDPNYKPDAEIVIDGDRQIKNLNLYATEEDLKYINNADNTDPTVMAWEGKYTKDNPNGLKATQGNSATFTFKVNPWPNENDRLSLIKLNGTHDQKEFVQGQTIETGINVENLDDNAKERLVGQVYHPVTGKVVPGAEAYIDDNGKVHVKMPEGALKLDGGKYVVNEDSIFAKDPDYKGLTHLDVRFFARPRTKAEFETIAGEYGTYTETGAGSRTIKHKGEDIEIDKQGIDRYDHYNIVGGFKINLDDTKYYEQDFKNDSGEKIDLSTTTKVTPGKTFTVSILDPEEPDDTQKTGAQMNDAYKKGQASGKLKEEFLVTANKAIARELGISYDELMKEENKDKRWVMVGEGDNISHFTIRAPKSSKAGDNLTLPVEYTYTNGSTDLHWFHFVVQESVLNKPEYEVQVDFPSEEQTSPVKITENEKKLSPVRYSIKEGFNNKDNQGNEWTVSIDEKTGQVTAQPKNSGNFSGGEKLKVPVVAHYEDPLEPDEDITEETTAEFIIKERANMTPRYNAKAGKAGDKLSSDVILDEKDEFNRKPTKFTLNTNIYTDDKGNTWHVYIDEKTGTVTATVPNAEEGKSIDGALVNVPVTAHYYDGETEKGTKEIEVQFIASGTEGKYEKTLEMPFETKVEKNSNLKKGEIKVITEGKVGSKKVTYTIKDSEVIKEEETQLVYPQDRLIQVGEGVNDGTHEIKEKSEVPYDIEIEFSDDLKPGEQEVVQEGVPGEKTRTTTLTIEDGKVTNTQEGEFTETKAPQKKIIKVGANTDGEVVHKEEIPFKYTVEYDPSVEAGKYVEETPGKNGERVTTWTIKNSEVVGEPKTVETKPVDAVIKVGTKDFTGEFKTTKTEAVEFETEYRVNNELQPGEVKEVQKGELGEKETEVTHTIKNGEVTKSEEGETKQTKAPVKRIVEVGPGKTDGTHKIEEKEEVPFEVEIQFDDSLAPGEQKVTQEGVPGEKTRTTTLTIENSEITNTEVGDFEVTKEPVKKIIKVGRNTEGEVKHVEKIPFKYSVNEVDTLKKGEYEIVKPGKVGTKTTTWKIENSKIVGEPKTETVEAEDAIINVGKGTNDGTHEVTEKVPVPFETIIEFDDSLAPGEQKVTQEGVPGEKTRTTTLTIEDGQVTNTESGEFEQNKAPVNRIIKVGRNTDGEVVHKEEIPFKYTVNEVDTLKKGEYEIVKPGKVGTKTTTWKIENSEIVGEPKTEIVEAEDAIINVGKGTNDGTHEVTEKVPVPFETIIEFDDSLAPGEQKVTQEGVPGEKTRTTTLTIEDGQVTNTESGEFEQNKAPVNRIIKVGRNTDGEVVHKEEIPFKYTVEYDPELKAGEYKVETPGKNGERITTWTIKNSKVDGDPKVVETQPIDAVIKVGSKDFTGEFKTTKTEAVEFETEYRVNNELQPGEVKEVQKGELGEKETEVTHTIKNGEVTESVEGETKQTKAPVKRIVEVGPGATDGTYTYTNKKPFEVEVRVNPKLPKGEYNILQKGVEGEEEYTVTIKDSKVTNTSEPRETKAPVKEIIEVGSADFTGTVEYVDKDPIPYETEVTVDPSLKPGEIVEDQKGELGEQETKITRTITNGKAGEEKRGETKVTKEPVNRKIRVGSQTDGQYKETETIPFETEVRKDPSLKKGEWKYAVVDGVPQTGKNGLKERTLTIENSKITNTSEFTTIEEPKKAIILVGEESTDGVVEHKEEIPFEYTVEYDPDFYTNYPDVKDNYKIVTEGIPGEKTTKWTIKDSGIVGKPEENVTKEPVNAVIKVGQKDYTGTFETKKTKVVEFETEYIVDNSIEPGTTKVEQEGELGKDEITVTHTIENGKVTKSEEGKTTRTKEPVKRIVKVGPAKTDGTHTYTSKKPFEVEVRVNPELKKGEHKIVQKGVEGEEEYTITIENSKVTNTSEPRETKAPVKEIIEVGSADFTGTVEYVDKDPIPYETEVTVDPSLKPGEIVEDQKGELGEQETKISRTITNGKAGEENRGETTRTKEPVNRKIRVGSNTNGQYKETETIPFEVEVRKDPTLGKGEWKYAEVDGVQQTGESGLKERIITIINSKVTEESEFKTTREPKNAVILVGDDSTEGEVRHTEEIPFGYKVEESDELKPGEYKIVKPGKIGTKTTTWKIKDSQIEGEPKEEIVPAEDALIQVGKGTPDGTHDFTEKKEIPFETRYEYDDSLEPGEEKVVTPGSPGEQERTNTIVIENGKVKEIKEGEFKTTKEPQERLIKIGRKPTEGETTKTIEREIPYETKVIYDDTLEAGFQKIENEGKPGKEEVTITQKIKDSKPVGDPTETTKTITEKEDRVVRIGVKPVEKIVELGNNTEYRHNPELEAGEEKVIEEGSKGSVKYTTTFNKETGKLEVKEERVEPTNKIVEYGTKTDGEFTYESEKAYDIIIRENPNLEAGKTKIIQGGIVGKTETTVKIENSKEVDRTTKTITEKQDKIIEIGTKNVCEIPPVDPEEPDKPVDPEEPGEDKPDPETPGEDKPDPEKPGEDKPDPETPGEDKPNPEKPGEDKPDPEKPGEDKPDPEKPGEDKPNPEKPDEDKPEYPRPSYPWPWNPRPNRPYDPDKSTPNELGENTPSEPSDKTPNKPEDKTSNKIVENPNEDPKDPQEESLVVSNAEDVKDTEDVREETYQEEFEDDNTVENKTSERKEAKVGDKAPKTQDPGIIREIASAGLASGLLLLLKRFKRRK